MAALKRGVVYLSFLRNSARILLSCRKPAVHKLGKWTNVLYTSIASLTVGAGLCAVPFKQVENLTHDSLIKRAASLAVHTLVALQRRYLASLGKLSPAEEDSIWQVIIGQRAEVNDRQDECRRFESTWVSAVKMCETAAEAAYTSGAEHACITVRTNIQMAQSQVEEARKLSVDADKKLTETKVMEIERMVQQNNNDEEEVPEAYLRED
ncbi:diablo homolog, mitochondrial-like isoform X2 [Toxotes jaculatrix]|uniref:diablo homolog, mitochondrial-like isoform X2 n=1 Tax=Toxotes jaculatrix TaxID=941984 RepID=UPI001B3B15AC|nr:diablo homolog, mitochondrial-like isoform X2 [Toxotes jaculatrix]